MKQSPPSIVKAAERLMVEIESAVAAFPRRHKYQLGADLRAGCVESIIVAQQAYRASKDRPRQALLVDALSLHIDKLKIQLQVAQRLQCYSFQRFELLANIAVDLGKQCGGWKRQIADILKGQNPAATRLPERTMILSTHAASMSEAKR